jgi:8-oxo-dGTP diphosphatase
MSMRPAVGVGGIVRDGAGRVLLVRRARGVHAGLWSFPGGHVEWGERLAAAVAREVREETGLAVTVGRLLYVAEVMEEEADPTPFHYVVLDFGCDVAGGFTAASSDADAARWVGPSEWTSLLVTPSMRQALTDPLVREFLGWSVGGA